MNASPGRVESIGDARTVFLSEALGPLRQWLDNDKVVEIIANGPGELYVEIIGESSMQRVEAREVTVDWLRHLAERVAGFSNQSVNAEHPLLSAALASGSAFKACCRRRRQTAAPSRFVSRSSRKCRSTTTARWVPSIASRCPLGRALGPRSRALRIFGRRKNRGFHPRRGEASLHHAALWRNVVRKDDVLERDSKRGSA